MACCFIHCKNQNVKSIDQDHGSVCVKMILEKDSELGSKRNHDCESTSLSNTIDIYTQALSDLDFSDCPSSFSQAFQEHINAWIEMKEVTDGYPDLRGEMHDLFDQIRQTKDSTQFKIRLNMIWSTWESIEKLSGQK